MIQVLCNSVIDTVGRYIAEYAYTYSYVVMIKSYIICRPTVYRKLL